MFSWVSISADDEWYFAKLMMNGVLQRAVFGHCCLFLQMPCFSIAEHKLQQSFAIVTTTHTLAFALQLSLLC